MTVDLVHEPALMSPAWLTAALADAFPGCEVTGSTWTPVGTGLMARSFRLRLEGTECPDSIVAKVPSEDATTRELGARAYTREVGFYEDVATTMRGRIPACHHADISETGSEFVLLLEDIDPARQGDQIDGCSLADARRAIGNLARLHGSTWGREDEHPWLGDDSRESLALYMQMAMEAFAPRFVELVEPQAMDVFWAFAAGADVWQEHEPSTRAVLHGDYRLDNLLFSTTHDWVAAVDWQTMTYASPARDLAYFLGNSLTTDDRRTHEQDLIDHYLATLGEMGVEHEPAVLHAELVHGAFQGPLVTALGAFTATRTERSEAMFAAMANRCAAQILDHGGLDLL